ncbi:hypothetical protein HBB16_14855 [Pseudonocardia sp. MCCB 268]|nr:hypothetical protein [Pseudonocardia cytotoxica]
MVQRRYADRVLTGRVVHPQRAAAAQWRSELARTPGLGERVRPARQVLSIPFCSRLFNL